LVFSPPPSPSYYYHHYYYYQTGDVADDGEGLVDKAKDKVKETWESAKDTIGSTLKGAQEEAEKANEQVGGEDTTTTITTTTTTTAAAAVTAAATSTTTTTIGFSN